MCHIHMAYLVVSFDSETIYDCRAAESDGLIDVKFLNSM